MTYTFEVNQNLVDIVQSTQGKKCKAAYQKKQADPSLWIVKDEGCYLMSAAMTRKAGEPVHYAIGCLPADGHIGGDDFAENLPLKWFEKAIAEKRKTITIKITEKEIEVL